MRIAVDAAGPEPCIDVIIAGALDAVRKTEGSGFPIEPVFYGPGQQIKNVLHDLGAGLRSFEVVDSPDIVQQTDRPAEVLQSKTSSSIVRAMQHLSTGVVSAFVSMGNTGAVVGAARTFLGRIRWISKPALAAPLPRHKGTGLLLDVGATSDIRANHLIQFAAMGSAFLELIYKVENPRIGLLNIGAEAHKGNEITRDAYKLLSKGEMNFVGNIEGNSLLMDKADVVVTSGFVGNILLKFTESIPDLIRSRLQDHPGAESIFESMLDLDYSRYGGATLLGVNGPVVVGHGRSNKNAVTQALLWASVMVERDLTRILKDSVFRARRALWLSNPFSRAEGSEEDG